MVLYRYFLAINFIISNYNVIIPHLLLFTLSTLHSIHTHLGKIFWDKSEVSQQKKIFQLHSDKNRWDKHQTSQQFFSTKIVETNNKDPNNFFFHLHSDKYRWEKYQTFQQYFFQQKSLRQKDPNKIFFFQLHCVTYPNKNRWDKQTFQQNNFFQLFFRNKAFQWSYFLISNVCFYSWKFCCMTKDKTLRGKPSLLG